MNYYALYQQPEHDPSAQNQQLYDHTANNYYSYAYSNPQYPVVQPYSYPNLTVQPSQHEEQEPNPPGVTPAPQSELGLRSYYPLTVGPQQQGAVDTAVAGVHPPVWMCLQQQGAVDTAVAGVHPPNVQSSYSSVGFINGIASGSDAQNHLIPNPNVPHQSYHVHGTGSSGALQMNAGAVAHPQNQAVIIHGGPHQPLPQPYQPISHSYAEPHLARGQNIPGRPYRGGGRGRGRGRGRAAPAQHRGGPSQPISQSVATPAQSAPVLPPPKAVWCDLCRVECNTVEILKQHLSGKKHIKKQKVFEESQNLNKRVTGSQTEQPSIPELKPEVPSQPDQIEGSGNQQLLQESLPSQAINGETQEVVEEQKLVAVETGEETKKVSTGVERGLKRKMRGGKVIRRTKPFDRSKKVVEPPKPKQVPLVCELCNVKCESNVVFQSHLVGKKHLSKAKRFQETLGQQPVLLHPQAPPMQVVGLQNANANASTCIVSQVPDQAASAQNLQTFVAQAPVLNTVSQPFVAQAPILNTVSQPFVAQAPISNTVSQPFDAQAPILNTVSQPE